jgi:plastocyanin
LTVFARKSLAVLAACIAASTITVACSTQESGTPAGVPLTGDVFEVVVPMGTFEQVMRGEFVDLLPSIIEVSVGDEFVVVNEDKVTHTIGPFSVRPGETLRHVWQTVDTIQGECSVLMSDNVIINVGP